MNFLRQVTHALGHQDVTTDTNGDEVFLWANGADPNPQVPCDAGIVKVRLSDAKQTCVWRAADWSNAYHISAPDNSGWFFIETYNPVDVIPPAGWVPQNDEILQIKLDGSEVRRLLHHRSRPLNGYTYQPKASVSHDGTKLVFTSNFGLQKQMGYPTEYSDEYLVDISGTSPGTGGTTGGSTGSTTGGSTGGTTGGSTGGTTGGSTGGTTGGSTGGTTGGSTGGTTGGSTGGTTSGSTGSTTGGSTGGTTGGSTGGTTGGSTNGSTGVPTLPAVTRVQQNGAGVTYTGNWVANNGSINSGGSAVMAEGAGSKANIAFVGTGVSWIGYGDEWSGIAKVYVDGALKGTIDTYSSPGKAQNVMYSVSGLASGSHSLTIEVTGTKSASSAGAWIWVDAFDVASGGASLPSGGNSAASGPAASGCAATPTRVQQNAGAVKYTGTWAANNGSINSGGSAVLTATPGARATFTFNGCAARWIAYRDEWSGIANIYVDGVLKSTVDTYSSPGAAQAVMYTVTGLTAGPHTLVVEATGQKSTASKGTWVWVDAFDYQ
jgi:hypothetical protein